MGTLGGFERYMETLCERLGHADRQRGFIEYSQGLMLPIERNPRVSPCNTPESPRWV